MGLFQAPKKGDHHESLPLHSRTRPYKERYSDDSYSYSDDEVSLSTAGHSRTNSRNISTSSTSPIMKNKISLASRMRASPYRLPTKITRYLCLLMVGFILFLVLSLVRASRLENWKLANGMLSRPPPPPLWEKFPFLERYYGGIRTLQPVSEWKPEYPLSGDEGQASHTQQTPGATAEQLSNKQQRAVPASKPWVADVSTNYTSDKIAACYLDADRKVGIPHLHYYEGRTAGFPAHIIGSYDLLNLREDVCFDRWGRYGSYGFGYSPQKGGLGVGEHSENEGGDSVWDDVDQIDYRKIDWTDAQRRCFNDNIDRFKPMPERPNDSKGFYIDHGLTKKAEQRDEKTAASAASPKLARSALVIRSYDDFKFREDDIANLRALITELSLATGGRYDIHLLLQVKDDSKYPIWADDAIYQERIKSSVPEEFQGMVTLWTETQMLALYQGIHDTYARGPGLPIHGVYRGLAMAMQHFAYLHPEYDYFWHWEMDIRYTGHYQDLLSKLEDFGRKQPRKGLWERNERFYIPSSHGSWEDFSHMARVQAEMGTDNGVANIPGMRHNDQNDKVKNQIVWGPQRPADEKDWFEHEDDPEPPTSSEKDKYTWGVGEEADLIMLNPMFNPEGTTWGLRDDLTGYNISGGMPPRRASIITTSRMSRRLLMSMHRATAFKKQFGFPEMWPATVALQHGYKAVYAPHPIYVDRKWPSDFLAKTLNAGLNGATGGSRNSVYGDREHNLRGLTWFYNTGFSPNLYRRWLGMKVNNDGGDEFERVPDESKSGTGVGDMAGGEGRMCLPPMLLHPVKDVELPAERPPAESAEGEVLDAAA